MEIKSIRSCEPPEGQCYMWGEEPLLAAQEELIQRNHDTFMRNHERIMSSVRQLDGVTDHCQATIDMLLSVIKKLESGASPEDLGGDVILIGRMMARRT